MTTSELIVEVQWPARQESVERCAEKLAQQFAALTSLSPAFAEWVKYPRSLKAEKTSLSKPPVNSSNTAELIALLLKGQNRTDSLPRQPIPDLGFDVLFWNRKLANIDASLSVGCGSYAERVGYNRAALSIGTPAATKLTTDMLLLLLKQMVQIWETNLGVIYHNVFPPPEGKRHVQLAYFVVPRTDTNPIWRMTGIAKDTFNGGTLFVNEKARSLFEALLNA